MKPTQTESGTRLAAWFRDALLWEAQCLVQTANSMGPESVVATRMILECSGRVIFSGMGKMGHVARKAAATFCSTGTPALFLHPVEAFHGDLGIVCPGDLLIALSGGGETREVIDLVPFMRQRGINVIAVTCRPDSSLAVVSQAVLKIDVEREADPIATAPTASTTVALAICDALAIAVMHQRGFTREQFAELHPGGFIGRKLLTTVADLMHTGDRLPIVTSTARMRDAIFVIGEKRLGCAFVIGEDGRLAGILTDGDVRRTLAKHENPLSEPVQQYMTNLPATIGSKALAAEAIRVMESRSITVLPVIDDAGIPIGVLHLHDLVQAGMV